MFAKEAEKAGADRVICEDFAKVLDMSGRRPGQLLCDSDQRSCA